VEQEPIAKKNFYAFLVLGGKGMYEKSAP